MTILVAGGSGLVGSAIVRAYEKTNEDVIGISSKDLNLLDRDKTFKFIKEIKPSVVIDAAAKVVEESNKVVQQIQAQSVEKQKEVDAANIEIAKLQGIAG